MEPTGWLLMILSISCVLGLVGYCLYRVFTLPPVDVEEHLHSPLDIDTRDTADAEY